MRLSRTKSVLYVALLALLLAFPPAPPANAAEGDDPIEARAFEVHYRNLSDIANLVGATLSKDGSITLKPGLNTLVVEDRVSVLERVETLLASFDLPPREVEVTLSLFLGQREDAEEGDGNPSSNRGALSTEVRGMVESLGDFTRWTSYELLGSRSISGVEGDPVTVTVGGDYLVGFNVDSVVERQGVVRIKFDEFSLKREVLLGDGGRDIEELYTAGLVVEANKLTLVIAASAPDSKRALFLALQVSPR